eukprot:1160443-Pelagomonas_calceolata.AAC.13
MQECAGCTACWETQFVHSAADMICAGLLALVTAAKAVAFALTPGMEKIDVVSMWSRKRGLGKRQRELEYRYEEEWHIFAVVKKGRDEDPRGAGAGPSVEFVPSEKNLDPNWHPEQVDIMDWATNVKVGWQGIERRPAFGYAG